MQCRDTGSGDQVTRTICYDNFNKNAQFFVSLQPGTYDVTVAVGWPARTRDGDVEYVEVNDVVVRNFTCSSAPGTCTGSREDTQRVIVKSHGTGGMLIISVGSPYANAYMEVGYVKIAPVTAGAIVDAPTCGAPTPYSPCSGQTAPPTTTTTTAAPTTTLA